MEYPIKIKPTDGLLLQALGSEERAVEVREGDGLRWMHFGDDAIQAMMIIDDPATPIIPYQIYMLAALSFSHNPNFLLNLGAGGGSFERFFAAHLPELMVTSVETNPDVIRLLKEHFSILGDIPIIKQDAEAFLSDCATCYDLILCDLFDHADHPSCLFDSDFYADVFRCLSNNGVFAINLLPESESEMVNILLVLRSSFEWIYMLEVPHYKNIILFCTKKEAPVNEELELRCERLFEDFGLDLTDVAHTIVELPKRQS